MFTIWQVSTFLTLFLYGLIFDFNLLKVWLWIFGVYHVFSFFTGKRKYNGVRRIVRMATWNPPSDPNAYIKVELDVSAAEKLIEEENRNNPDLPRLTLTHVALRSLGEGFMSKPKDYGKIVFGK